MTPQRQKQKTLEALLAWLLALAEQQPVLSVVESLHWIDPYLLMVKHFRGVSAALHKKSG